MTGPSNPQRLDNKNDRQRRSWLVGLLICFSSIAFAAEAPAPFKITTKRADDQIVVDQRKGAVVFAIRSPTIHVA